MSWALPALALVLLAYAAASRRLDGTPITGPMVWTAAGLLVGSKALGVVDLRASDEAVRLLAEATLACVLFADASRIDLVALRRELAIPARLLGIGLPLTILAGIGAGVVLLGDLRLAEVALLAVILAPTDAALGQAVVTMPALPSRVRQGLNVESGLNDGICVPIFLALLEAVRVEEGGDGGTAALRLVAEQIGYGAAAGCVAGALAAVVLVASSRRDWIDPLWAQVVPLAAAALAYASAVPVGGSGFIAAFVGGAVFGGLRRRVGGEVSHLIEEVGGVLGAVTFVVFGASLLGPAIAGITVAGAAYAAVSLTVVRMAPVALALVGSRARRPTVGFLGWFGPRGLASIVFAIMLAEGDLPHEGTLTSVAVLAVGLSVVAHGATAAPLARRYAAWYAGHPRPDSLHLEGRAAGVHVPWRLAAWRGGRGT